MTRSHIRSAWPALLLPLSLLLSPPPAGAAAARDAETSDDSASLDVLVTILPHAGLVERLGGEAVRVHVLVGPDQSPETYQPSPRQLQAFSPCRIWFTTGTPVETALRARLAGMLPQLEIVPTHLDLEVIHDHQCSHHDHDHHHQHSDMDPHVWVSARNTALQAAVMAAALQDRLPAHAGRIATSLAELHQDLDRLDTDLTELLLPVAGRTFFVFHPAFGYFARDYDLRQEAVESGGLAPSPRRLARIMQSIRDQGATTIYIQPQQSVQSVQPIASREGLDVIVLDPLDPDHLNNLRRIGETLRAGLEPPP
jgi:zinc transport system substrate-binding protein